MNKFIKRLLLKLVFKKKIESLLDGYAFHNEWMKLFENPLILMYYPNKEILEKNANIRIGHVQAYAQAIENFGFKHDEWRELVKPYREKWEPILLKQIEIHEKEPSK